MPSKFTYAREVKVGQRILVEPVEDHAFEGKVVDIDLKPRENGSLLFEVRRGNGRTFRYEIPPWAPIEVRW